MQRFLAIVNKSLIRGKEIFLNFRLVLVCIKKCLLLEEQKQPFAGVLQNRCSHRENICSWNIRGTFPWNISSMFGENSQEIPGNIPK